MLGGKRKLSNWNLLVQKVYKEGKAKNSNYDFKQALTDASKRKSEMGEMKSHTKTNKKMNKSKRHRKRSASRSRTSNKKTRKR
tara:strand:- start:1078 stop:1326 length:249 start_codon:yes stop_codon:yes gene_type:complete